MTARRRLPRAALAAAIGAVAGLGCNVYDASLLVARAEAGAPMTGTDGVGWWSEKRDGCLSAGVPTLAHRPKPTGGASLPPIYVAIDSMRLGSEDKQGKPDETAWQTWGFDLDGVCTNAPDCPSQVDKVSCKPPSVVLPVDGEKCRDNLFGKLDGWVVKIPEMAIKYGLHDDLFNCSICFGQYNFLVKISEWNGQPDDDVVRADIYPSPGLENPRTWNCLDPKWCNYPCWKADEPWTVQEDMVTGLVGAGDLPPSKLYDDKAYVRGGYMVMRLPATATLWFPGKNAAATAYPMKLSQGLVVGKIQKTPDGTWEIADGMIAGRMKVDDIISSFELVGLCDSTDKGNYDVMVSFSKSNLDISSSGSAKPDDPCDAVSVGIAFKARQAAHGKAQKVDPLVKCQGKPPPDGGAASVTTKWACQGGK